MKFKVGDLIEAELNESGEPRWQYMAQGFGYKLVDTGYSGNFIRATVTAVTAMIMEMGYFKPDKSFFSWNVALENHPSFEKDQWTYPGFPILVPKKKPVVVCTCGAWAVYGKKNCPGHSNRCDLYQPNPYTGM